MGSKYGDDNIDDERSFKANVLFNCFNNVLISQVIIKPVTYYAERTFEELAPLKQVINNYNAAQLPSTENEQIPI